MWPSLVSQNSAIVRINLLSCPESFDSGIAALMINELYPVEVLRCMLIVQGSTYHSALVPLTDRLDEILVAYPLYQISKAEARVSRFLSIPIKHQGWLCHPNLEIQSDSEPFSSLQDQS